MDESYVIDDSRLTIPLTPLYHGLTRMASWLETLRQKQRRVSELEAELMALRSELRDARAILRGDEPVHLTADAKPKSRHGFVGGKRSRPIQEGSSVWWTREILKDSRTPLSVDEIITRIKDITGNDVRKTTLVSNLSRYVKHGDTFVRPEPSKYGLMDYEAK